MRITCPYCRSQATLTPNPAQGERSSLPRYVLKCSGCDRTTVRRDPVGQPSIALGEDSFACVINLLLATSGESSQTTRLPDG